MRHYYVLLNKTLCRQAAYFSKQDKLNVKHIISHDKEKIMISLKIVLKDLNYLSLCTSLNNAHALKVT